MSDCVVINLLVSFRDLTGAVFTLFTPKSSLASMSKYAGMRVFRLLLEIRLFGKQNIGSGAGGRC